MVDQVFDRWMGVVDVHAARAAGTLLANSAFSAESIARAYGRQARVSYLGTDPDVFTLGGTDRAGVLSVGAVQPMKGHHLVIEACGRIPAERRPSVTVVYEREEPHYRARLEASAAERGVDLRLQRSVPDHELAAMYRGAAATVGAASLEPFGLSLVESLASGAPVVAVAEGGYREVVDDGRNGVLVERDAGEVASALMKVLDDPGRFPPADLRASVLPMFSWEAAADRYDRALSEAIH
jgi:glycosyltransferase involved in cell wall biosynthesis